MGMTDGPTRPNPFGDIAPKGRWTEITPSDFRTHPEIADELFELVQGAYKPVGGHLKVKDRDDILQNMSFWVALDIDEDPEADVAIMGKRTPFGVKQTATGHDTKRPSKRAGITKKIDLLTQRGNYAEVSHRLADILIEAGVPTVTDPEKVRRVLKKKITWHGDHPTGEHSGYGWYSRKIGGKPVIKILVGAPALNPRSPPRQRKKATKKKSHVNVANLVRKALR